jgi:quaternary ammonium compound-resistance protein SugE
MSNSPWVTLVIAGMLEFCWAIGLKYSEGFTKLWPTIWTISAMLLSVWLLSLSMQKIPIATAYCVWVGIGSVGTVIFGIIALDDPVNLPKILCLTAIIGGIAGLKALS